MKADMTEADKMRLNIPFNPAAPELVARRTLMRRLEMAYNRTGRDEMELRAELLSQILGGFGEDVLILPNIHFDYGCNVYIGAHSFVNVNSTFIDVARIDIGEYVLIGPNVTLCTATHPICSSERRPTKDEIMGEYTIEYSHPIEVESDVWIGAGVIVNPGVHVGRGSVIGSGSVVTHDIPQGVVAAGVPCRVLREITEADSLGVKGY